MATMTPIGTYTHRAPVMFCAAGNPQDVKTWTGFGGHGNTIDDLAPWPQGSQLRVSVMSGTQVPGWVIDIIKSAAEQWASPLGETLKLQWVSSSDSSDIRISFRTDIPSFSYVGARASMHSQSQPTMNFNFGGWKDAKAVYSHAFVKRLASHLFGHAMGLPHAYLGESPFQWKADELEKLCGSHYANMIKSAKGSNRLRIMESIMRFDVPAALSTKGKDILQGGSGVDSEALNLVRSLYPPLLDACSLRSAAQHHPGFEAGWNGRAVGDRRFNVAQTSNIVTGIEKIDMGLNGNFRLNSSVINVDRGSGYTLRLGAWDNTHLIDATCNVISFHEADTRVQTGRVDWSQLSGGNERSGRQNFSRPFNKTPNVVAFISGLDTAKGRQIRMMCLLQILTETDSIVYGMGVSWLAHEPDDWTIRSGLFDPPLDPNQRERFDTREYSSPLRRDPKHMFYALSHIDVHPNKNIRLAMEVRGDYRKADAKFFTWEDESKFYRLKGVYVAALG
ncbi:hypothetical protein B0T20DRAFT_498418 [Sordaria brevicollis]|uniref:H-type lectin domain-containing protein n=1 Tax=Sordaria brevicollis TaxID=83679 RepID=A0AAE0UBZ8_SORBR|nr:hypothetical protein B0T20DRAFT_498418 [Sordaria brevicollis]